MRHLVLSWSYLLHHKQCQAHEAKTVAEILQYDTTANKQSVFWLERCEQRIYYKGKLNMQHNENNVFLSPRADI